MPNNANERTEIDFFPSRSYTDRSADDALRDLVRRELLLKRSQPYSAAKIRVRQEPGETRVKTLVVYMLRSDCYTANVVQLTVEDNSRITNVSDDYVDTEDAEGPVLAAPNDFDFFIGAPPIWEQGVSILVQEINELAVKQGLTPRLLTGDGCTIARYQECLRAGYKGFVNIGHGTNKGQLVLYDGTLDQEWFLGLKKRECNPEVIFFNSCYSFEIHELIINAGARTFIGATKEVLIEESNNFTKLFWEYTLTKAKDGMIGCWYYAMQETKGLSMNSFGFVGDRKDF